MNAGGTHLMEAIIILQEKMINFIASNQNLRSIHCQQNTSFVPGISNHHLDLMIFTVKFIRA